MFLTIKQMLEIRKAGNNILLDTAELFKDDQNHIYFVNYDLNDEEFYTEEEKTQSFPAHRVLDINYTTGAFMVEGGDQLYFSLTKYMNASSLKELSKSIDDYVIYKRDGIAKTKSMELGTAFHAWCEGTFWQRYIDAPEKIDGRTAEGKALKKFLEESGKIPISVDDFQKIQIFDKQIRRIPFLRNLIFGNNNTDENNVAWDKYTEAELFVNEAIILFRYRGVLAKAMIDKFLTNSEYFIDYKTTSASTPQQINKAVINYQYHIQAVWYQRAIYALTGQAKRALFFFAQTVKPYGFKFYELDYDFLQVGQQLIDKGIDNYLNYLEYQERYDMRDLSDTSSFQIETLYAPKWLSVENDDANNEGL